MSMPIIKKSVNQIVNIAIASTLLGLSSSSISWAGSYIFAGEAYGTDIVTHPIGYNGSSPAISLNICIDSASQNVDDMVIPVQNVINTWNKLKETTGNVRRNVLASGKLDIESVLLHETGHCIGLGHPNFSASVISGAANNSTLSTNGADNNFNLNSGADGIYGSADDIRGDDENLHWFNTDNNPFIVIEPVDQFSFQRTIDNLPVGDNFAVNADRTVSSTMGYSNTEASMQQTTFTRETQRELAADDVSSLLFSRSGLDRTDGTSDDYSVTLNYNGIVTNAKNSSSCDISISIDEPSSFAFCRTSGVFLNASNIAITAAEIHLGTGFNWFFNDQPNEPDTPPPPPPPPADVLNFNSFSLGSYAGNQDGVGTVNIEDGGASLRLTGNRWQQLAINYILTPETVIEFDYTSGIKGEIQGLGFNNTLSYNVNHSFQLFGTQNWGIQDYHNYSTSSGTKHYVIPVGEFYTGSMKYLFFMNDHDVSSPNSESIFSNLKVYENAAITAPDIISTPSTTATVGLPYAYDADNIVDADGSAPINFSLLSGPSGFSVLSNGQVSWTPASDQEGPNAVSILASNSAGSFTQNFTITVNPAVTTEVLNFNDFTLARYAGGQDGVGTVSIEDGGTSLRLTGNRWQQLILNYTITPDTVIEFDFSSSVEGEIQGLGLHNTLNYKSSRTFQLFGTQNWGLQNHHDYSTSNGVKHYVIPVGEFYTGFMDYLFFVSDQDIPNPNAESLYSNVRVYENTL